MQKRQDDEEMEGADQAGQAGGAGTLHRRAGEKRCRTGEDCLEQLNYCPGIKFGSFTIAAIPVGLQRCGDQGGEAVPEFTIYHDAPMNTHVTLSVRNLSNSLERG